MSYNPSVSLKIPSLPFNTTLKRLP